MEKHLSPFTAALAVGIVAVAAITGAYLISTIPEPDPYAGKYDSGAFSFEFPNDLTLMEYSAGAVAVGSEDDKFNFTPLVEVTRYRSDIDRAIPPTFDEFVKRQLTALCGTDANNERVACSAPVAEVFTSPQGYEGQKFSLTVTRTNLTSGTTSTATFAPVYVFETKFLSVPPAPAQYEGVFIHPSFSSILAGTVSTEALDKIIASLVIPRLEPEVETTVPAL